MWAAVAEAELSWPPSVDVPALRDGHGHYSLFLGPRRSGTSMHYHKAAWNALLHGRKLWALVPPRVRAGTLLQRTPPLAWRASQPLAQLIARRSALALRAAQHSHFLRNELAASFGTC